MWMMEMMGKSVRMRTVLVNHPKVLTPEEDEEQLIMRRMRNSVDELRRGYRFLFIVLISSLIIDIIILVMSMDGVLLPIIVGGQVVGLQDAEGEDKGQRQQGHQGGN